MQKTIVCIVEEDMTLNYLFVKEMTSSSDEVMIISQQKTIPIAKHFMGLFPEHRGRMRLCALDRDGDEDLWDVICRTVRRSVQQGVEYHVNLSGGTRLMSIAVQQVFDKSRARFYFMPLDMNAIIHSHIDDNNDNNDDEIIPIKYRLSIDEYLRINGVRCAHKRPSQSRAQSEDICVMFTQHGFSGRDYDIIEQLRDLRNRGVQIEQIDGLAEFLNYINFSHSSDDKLTSHEVQYLTGGWFEEYIYYMVQEVIAPTDLAIGVDVQRDGSHNHNDLDVVFTLNNRLFAIECKTGVGPVGLYNKMVYKACALKEALLGLRSNAYIFSLNEDPKDQFRQTARNMGISFCDRSYALDKQKLKNLFLNSKLYL